MKKLIILGILAIASIAHAQRRHQIVVVPSYSMPAYGGYSTVHRGLPARPVPAYGYGNNRQQIVYVQPPVQVCTQPVYTNSGYGNYNNYRNYNEIPCEQQLRGQIVMQERYSRSAGYYTPQHCYGNNYAYPNRYGYGQAYPTSMGGYALQTAGNVCYILGQAVNQQQYGY